MIYDGSDQGLLSSFLAPWLPETLYCRGEAINVPVFLASLRRRGRRWQAYEDTFIHFVQPRLIITQIDNNRQFYGLAGRHPGIKTIFLQNGYRGFYQDVFEQFEKENAAPGTRPERTVDYMMTFGAITAAEYAKHIRGTAIPIGSFTNNQIPRGAQVRPGVIAFVSQYNDTPVAIGSDVFGADEFYTNPDRIILSWLMPYARETGRRVVIVTRSRRPARLAAEQAYFRALAGNDVEFASIRQQGDSYRSVDSAEVVVTNTSTLAMEAAARGKRTGFFMLHREIYAARNPDLVWDRGLVWPNVYPESGPFWTTRADTTEFRRIVDHLFSIDDAAWRDEMATQQFDNIMAYDPGNEKLARLLERELGPAATTRSS